MQQRFQAVLHLLRLKGAGINLPGTAISPFHQWGQLINFTDLMKSTLAITGIQSSLFWENPAANLNMFEEKIMAIRSGPDIIVLPEMFNTGFSMRPEEFAETMDGETVLWMKKMAIKKKSIITGSMIAEEAGHYYNRLIWMLPNGQYGTYDKRHLFAYAGEDEHYTPGTKRLIASVNGWKVNLMVCYDLRFPVWSSQVIGKENEDESLSPEYDVLIYVANWPERRSLAWKSLLQARAIENQCYVIGVNRVGNDGNGIYHSGDSMVVGPLGEIAYQKQHEEDVFSMILHKKELQEIRNRLPFWKDADDFIIKT